MLEILILIFLTKKIGLLAEQKGLPPGKWKRRTVFAWFFFEFFGAFLGIMMFGFDPENIFGLMAFALVLAFGGYLLVRRTLENKPDLLV
jgi:uncharacterized membrane protein YfcA